MFVPIKQGMNHHSPISLTIDILGSQEDIIQVKLKSGSWLPQPAKAAINRLYQVGEGVVELWMNGLLGRLRFDSDVHGYNIVGVEVACSSFLNPKHLDAIDAFRKNWVLLCEESGSEFGYFGDYPLQLETTYRDEEVLIALLSYEIDTLVEKAYWLTYLGSAITSRWGSHEPYPFHRQVEVLDSGAVVLHAGRGDNPVSGDEETN